MTGPIAVPPRITTAQVPVRPLPIKIRLFPDETTRSFLRRLEIANALHHGDLKKILRAARKPWIETISAWSGDSPERLSYAMPQLGGKKRVMLDHDKLTGRPDRHTIGTACHRCGLAHGAGSSVEIYTTHERVLCSRHGLWIGEGAPKPADQLSIRACPTITAAWHHHINLIERRGHARMRTAFHISGVINWRYQLALIRPVPALHRHHKHLRHVGRRPAQTCRHPSHRCGFPLSGNSRASRRHRLPLLGRNSPFNSTM